MFEDCSYLVADFTYRCNLRGSVPGLPTDSPNPHHKCNTIYIYIFFFFFKFPDALSLCCFARAFSGCSNRELLLTALRGLLIAVASLVTEHWLYVWASVAASHKLWGTGSVLGACSCFTACEIFLDQGSNL